MIKKIATYVMYGGMAMVMLAYATIFLGLGPAMIYMAATGMMENEGPVLFAIAGVTITMLFWGGTVKFIAELMEVK